MTEEQLPGKSNKIYDFTKTMALKRMYPLDTLQTPMKKNMKKNSQSSDRNNSLFAHY